MVYLIDDDGLKIDSKAKVNAVEGKSHLCIMDFDELSSVSSNFGINEKTIKEFSRGDISKFESHDVFDFVILNIPGEIDLCNKPQRVGIYYTSKLLLFVCSNRDIINDIVKEIKASKIKNVSIGRIVHLFFDKLTYDDAFVLDKIEQEVSDLEDALFISIKADLINHLIVFRKKLLTLKRYYEQLLEISESIEQNENGLIDNKVLRYFRIHTGRVSRLYNGIQNLREYVSQVREAYQAQIDINLNSIMKIFTVITAIFLPLTLIAGWYGMNLKMPEFYWDHAYLFVIGISISVVIVSLIYFKKKKWF